jgi:hypothetical protein
VLQDQVLPKHYFWESFSGKYFDERGNEVMKPIRPCSIYGGVGLGALEYYLGMGLGFISSEQELRSLPTIPNPTAKKHPYAEYELSLSVNELNSLEIDISEIELPITQTLELRKIGMWVETGHSQEDVHFFFKVKIKQLEGFKDAVRDHLNSLGVRRYSLEDRETGKPLL